MISFPPKLNKMRLTRQQRGDDMGMQQERDEAEPGSGGVRERDEAAACGDNKANQAVKGWQERDKALARGDNEVAGLMQQPTTKKKEDCNEKAAMAQRIVEWATEGSDRGIHQKHFEQQ